MRILLVNPAMRASFWTYSEVQDITGCPGYMPNIALPTLAALTPNDVEITIVDETVQPIDYDQPWDLVGITGYITQKRRMFNIADEFRRRGQLVAIGGPYASLSPATVRPHADILFIGEAEKTWPEFLADFRTGNWKNEYRTSEPVDIQSSPLPDVSKLKPGTYAMGVIQTSRGCPFECEFCDVIVYLGRKQRHKTPEQVVQELEQLHQAGYRHVFLADDNFTVNRRKAADLMTAVAAWNRRQAEPISFSTQLSIDVARDQDNALLDLCAEAGLQQAFIGIETPNQDALREVKKRQNLRSNLVADVHKVQSRGIMVAAGMVCGFDADTTDSFRAQYEFAQQAGVPIVAVSLLNAPEGTPLEKRLFSEHRLKPILTVDDGFFDTNIIPKRMTNQQLLDGTHWLVNKLYAPEAFLERIRVLAGNLPSSTPRRHAPRQAVLRVEGILKSYERMGPAFQNLPREAVKFFRKKDSSGLGGALMFYKNIMCVLQKWGVWNPALAQREEPDFAATTP